ncbi:hypothetical protein ACHQM5_018942 [Ranunculus cassubicifolius]
MRISLVTVWLSFGFYCNASKWGSLLVYILLNSTMLETLFVLFCRFEFFYGECKGKQTSSCSKRFSESLDCKFVYASSGSCQFEINILGGLLVTIWLRMWFSVIVIKVWLKTIFSPCSLIWIVRAFMLGWNEIFRLWSRIRRINKCSVSVTFNLSNYSLGVGISVEMLTFCQFLNSCWNVWSISLIARKISRLRSAPPASTTRISELTSSLVESVFKSAFKPNGYVCGSLECFEIWLWSIADVAGARLLLLLVWIVGQWNYHSKRKCNSHSYHHALGWSWWYSELNGVFFLLSYSCNLSFSGVFLHCTYIFSYIL